MLLDDLGTRFATVYRKGLSEVASVFVVRLDASQAAHRARNSSRPVRRRYPSATLDLFRASARRDGQPDLAIDTTDDSPDQTAFRLENLLRV